MFVARATRAASANASMEPGRKKTARLAVIIVAGAVPSIAALGFAADQPRAGVAVELNAAR
mgnify:CR=1 FL=1